MSKRKRNLPPQENPMRGDVPPEKQFYSVGFVCGMIQNTPTFVEQLMRRAGVEYHHYENGVGVIRGDDLQLMASVLQDERNQVEAAPSN